MWSVLDSRGVDREPKENTEGYFTTLFILIYMFFMSVIILNLFVGIVIETFSREKTLLSNN